MLGIPVTNSSNQVVALIFACNKIQTDSFDHFSPYDINAAKVPGRGSIFFFPINSLQFFFNRMFQIKAFALFCGIGIQNIIIYEKVVRAMNMQQVALDVLSYHASSKSDEVELLLVSTVFICTVYLQAHQSIYCCEEWTRTGNNRLRFASIFVRRTNARRYVYVEGLHQHVYWFRITRQVRYTLSSMYFTSVLLDFSTFNFFLSRRYASFSWRLKKTIGPLPITIGAMVSMWWHRCIRF
jgi:hypothetical protein